MADESRKRLWPDEDEWLDTFREYLCGHPELAEHVARIWFALIEHLSVNSESGGPEGVRNARFILNQAPRSTVGAAHVSVYPVIPAGVPALPAVAVGTSQAGGRTRAVAEGVDSEDEGVHRRSAESQE